VGGILSNLGFRCGRKEIGKAGEFVRDGRSYIFGRAAFGLSNRAVEKNWKEQPEKSLQKKVKRRGRKKALDGGRRKKSCCVVLCRREGGEHVEVSLVCLEFLFVVCCVRRVV
jgi:hypothetical protein